MWLLILCLNLSFAASIEFVGLNGLDCVGQFDEKIYKKEELLNANVFMVADALTDLSKSRELKVPRQFEAEKAKAISNWERMSWIMKTVDEFTKTKNYDVLKRSFKNLETQKVCPLSKLKTPIKKHTEIESIAFNWHNCVARQQKFEDPSETVFNSLFQKLDCSTDEDRD